MFKFLRFYVVLRQNSIHLRFQQLRLSFSQLKFSRSKFDSSVARGVNNGKLTVNDGCLQVYKNKERQNYYYGQAAFEERGLLTR